MPDIDPRSSQYGLFLIVKFASGGLHLKMFIIFIHLSNFGKFSAFLASSGSFNVKNDNIDRVFFLLFCFLLFVLVENVEFAGLGPE